MRLGYFIAAIAAALLLCFGVAQSATTILPQPKTCFANASGPLISGTVNTFVPNTTSPKSTWQDSSQTTLNANPIALDASGCALIYGVGSYRFQVFDSSSNLVYDALTTDTSASNAVFWAGTASALGTPNAILITDTGFNATDGSIINFIPLASNTGPTTLNPSSFGNISIVKDTSVGPVALSGGEIAIASGGLGNVVSVIYSATQNNFHLQNLIAAAVSPSTPLCGAIGLNITNDTTFPNSKMVITADQINMQTTLGTYITRGSSSSPVSISVNFTTTGASGFDGAAGTSFTTSSWYNLYAIDNGVAAAGLGSVSATAPTMPSGYSYKCRLGAVQTDSSGNFFRVLILGNKGQYKIGTNPTNTGAAPLLIGSGSAGSYSATSPTLTTATVTGNGFCAPPTATAIIVNAGNNWKGNGIASVLVAPNTSWGGTNNGPSGSSGTVYPIATNSAGQGGNMQGGSATIILEASTIAWSSSSTGGAITCQAWYDKVSAQ